MRSSFQIIRSCFQNRFNLRKYLIAAGLSPLLAGPALSQSVPDQVVITASGNQQSLRDALPAATVIEAEQIRASGASELGVLLARELGLDIARAGGAGQPVSVFMRGMESRHTLVLIDGVPATGESFGTALIEAIPLDAIERIEIVRGNVSALYGSNAVGGVIQVFTRFGKQMHGGSVSAGAGTQSSARLGASFKAGTDATQFSATAGTRKAAGVSALDPALIITANPDKDGSRSSSASASVQHGVSEALTLGATLLASRLKTDYDDAFAASPQLRQAAKSALGNLKLDAGYKLNEGTALTASVARFDERRDYTLDGAFDGRYASHRSQAAVSLRGDAGMLGVWKAGLEHERASVDQATTFAAASTASESRNALLAGFNGASSGFGWQLNVRRDGSAATTGYAGLRYALTAETEVLGSMSSAFVRPSLAQRFDPTYGNPALKPERARNAELALQWAQASNRVRATLFANRTSDLIGFDPITFASINIDRTRNRGLELLAELQVQGIGVRGGVTAQSPENAVTGKPLLRRAKQSAFVGLNGKQGVFGWNADLKFSGARDDLFFDPATFGSSAVRLPSFTTLGIGGTWAITSGLKLAMRADNLSNANDSTIFGYTKSPRSLQATLELLF
jgi:vitamin B12 transporter